MMLAEVLEGLAIRPDGIYLDGTYGRGGHARAILERLGPAGRVIALDKDPEAIAAARTVAAQDARLTIERGSFTMLARLAESCGVTGQVDGVLLDLGVSSPQLDDPRRGFSFSVDGPLDMRMDNSSGMTAAQWLASASRDEIADVVYEYGEERYARRIAAAIVDARTETPISTTRQLAELVVKAVPRKDKHKHPATRTFQGIRIFINRELDDLKDCLVQTLEVLASGGRLVAIPPDDLAR